MAVARREVSRLYTGKIRREVSRLYTGKIRREVSRQHYLINSLIFLTVPIFRR